MEDKVKIARPEHEVVYRDLVALINKNAGKLTALEILAVAANMLGKLVAMQDQRTVSPSAAMDVVIKNIEFGNKQVIDQLRDETKGRA
jgi:hypothetical protein